jgi:hypothetical protein
VIDTVVGVLSLAHIDDPAVVQPELAPLVEATLREQMPPDLLAVSGLRIPPVFGHRAPYV